MDDKSSKKAVLDSLKSRLDYMIHKTGEMDYEEMAAILKLIEYYNPLTEEEKAYYNPVKSFERFAERFHLGKKFPDKNDPDLNSL